MIQWQEKDFTLRWARQWMISDGMKKPSPHTVAGNEMGKLRNRPYQRSIVEQTFDRMIELFVPEWLQRVTTASTATPVFICGMFRSGSTLVEQMLASHPSITAGGELDYLPWLVAERLAPYPDGVMKRIPGEAG